MKIIDIQNWDRASHYHFYRLMDIPQFTMTFLMDITPLYSFIKTNGYPFYLSMIYFVMKTTNQIEAFKYRILGDDVVLFDTVHPSFTDLEKNSSLFKIVSVDMQDDLESFIANARLISKNQKDFIDLSKEKRQDWVFITSFPWAHYTSGTNAMNIDSKDAIPRISWGQYTVHQNQVSLSITIGAHHGLVDGYHVSLWLKTFNENILKLLK